MISVRWISIALLLSAGAQSQATARDARTITLSTVQCVRSVVEDFFAHDQDLPAVAAILESTRVNQANPDALVTAENQCKQMRSHLSDLSSAERAERRGWSSTQAYQENNLDSIARVFDHMIQNAEVRMSWALREMKDLNPNVRAVLSGFIQPMENCTQADYNLAVFFLAGKLGGAYCASTSGRTWLQLSLGGGYGLVGGAQMDIGGVSYTNRSWGFLFNGKVSERRMRAIMTAAAGEYFCGGFIMDMADPKSRPPMADCDMTDLSERPANIGTNIGGGIGVGIAPTGGKTVLYSVDMKLIPLGSDFKPAVDRLLRPN